MTCKKLTAILLALALSLTACADGSNEPAPAANNADAGMLTGKTYVDTYKTYGTGSCATLNYFRAEDAAAREIVSNCIDGLVEPDRYGVYVPSLAESWEASRDYTVWTFRIREGLKWMDCTGAETAYDLTAEDFVDGIRYMADPSNGTCPQRSVFGLIAGLREYYRDLEAIDRGERIGMTRGEAAARFDDMVGVKALDDCTVRYTLTSPSPSFLSLIESSLQLLPVEYDYAAEQGDDFGSDHEHLLYCGAYYIERFERGKSAALRANPRYWDKDSVTLAAIEYRMISGDAASVDMFRRGEIDHANFGTAEALSLQNTEWADKILPGGGSFSTDCLRLNFEAENPEFRAFAENENFRKALMYALDRTALAAIRDEADPAGILCGTVSAEGAVCDAGGTDYTDYRPLKELKGENYDRPQLARAYMQNAIAALCDEEGTIAGCESAAVDYMPVCAFETDGKLPVTICYAGPDNEEGALMAQQLKAMIEDALGSENVEFLVRAFAGRTEDAGPLPCDLCFATLATEYADPLGILSLFASDGAYAAPWCDVPSCGSLIEGALAARTFEERLAKFAEAESRIVEGGYVIPLLSGRRRYQMSYLVPHTGPLTRFGPSKYKGCLVLTQPVTYQEYLALDARYEAEREADVKTP